MPSNRKAVRCSLIECFCLYKPFPFVLFAIVLGSQPSLTSSGHRIPFCLLQCRLRPLGNTRRLNFSADSTLKRGLLARCRDRCCSPSIYTCPPLFVPRTPLTDLLTNSEGSGVTFVGGGFWGGKCFSSVVYLHEHILKSHPSRKCFVGPALRHKKRHSHS